MQLSTLKRRYEKGLVFTKVVDLSVEHPVADRLFLGMGIEIGTGDGRRGAHQRPRRLLWLVARPSDLEEVRQALDRIVKDVNRAGEVIGRIRALIRKAPRRKDSVDINEAVRELIELTRRNSPMVCRSSKAIAWNCNRWCSSSLSTPRKPWMRSPTRRVSCSLPPVKPSRTGCSLG
jgi:hypothetical protein